MKRLPLSTRYSDDRSLQSYCQQKKKWPNETTTSCIVSYTRSVAATTDGYRWVRSVTKCHHGHLLEQYKSRMYIPLKIEEYEDYDY